MSIDLRVELDALLKKWGHKIILQRVITPFEDPVHEYSKQLEIHTVRSMNVLASRFLADIKLEQTEGIEFPTEMIFWFKHWANPATGDLIHFHIPGIDDPAPIPGYPPSRQPLYEIDHPDPKFGLGGRIEFWACGATRIRPE